MTTELEQMVRLLREVAAFRVDELGSLIDTFREYGRQRRGRGPAQFDLLSLFKVGLTENQHSAFLAWLLDAEGSHNRGAYFLRAFLDACRPKVDIVIPDEYHVQTEFWGGKSSIDILVYQPRKFLVYIENKTTSPDTPAQLAREFQDMRRMGRALEIPADCQVAVYLTPTGRRPGADEDNGNEWYTVSYRDLGQTLEAVLSRLEDARLRVALESWLDAFQMFTQVGRSTMKGFSDESVLVARNWDTVLKIIQAKERLDRELGNIVSSVEAELKTLSWWGPGWRSWPEKPGFYTSNVKWQQDDGDLVVWLGIYDFDAVHVFGLETLPTLYMSVMQGHEDLKRALLEKWDSKHEADVRYKKESDYPIEQEIPKCLAEENSIRAYPEIVRQQMLGFFTRYATRLMEADELIREHIGR